MIYRGRFRTVRQKDHAVPTTPPRPVLGQGSWLDIRAWCRLDTDGPRLLVTTPRRTGGAVQRNRFRRRVRMAFLALVNPLRDRAWVVWVRPGRTAPPLHSISFQDIESQLRLALRRLSTTDTP